MAKFGVILAATTAILGVSGIASSANAAVQVINFTITGKGMTVVSSPADDLATASSISTTSWTASEVEGFPPAVLDLGPGDAVIISSPITTTVGSTITLSWDGGVYKDTLTIASVTPTAVPKVANFLDISATGELSGPGVPKDNESVLALDFTQAGGTGKKISGSGSYTDVSVVPEPATWALLGVGFASLGILGFAKRRRTPRYAF
jgi:hypothetical protein